MGKLSKLILLNRCKLCVHYKYHPHSNDDIGYHYCEKFPKIVSKNRRIVVCEIYKNYKPINEETEE